MRLSTFLSGFITATLPLSAQSAGHGGTATPRPSHRATTQPIKTVTLAAVGVAPRSLAIWKQMGARSGSRKQTPIFQVLSFTRSTHQTGKGTIYEVSGVDFFGKPTSASMFRSDEGPQALLRASLNGNDPVVEWSLDNGATWTAGEKDGDTWKVAFDSTFISMMPLDETFTPTAFKATAFERGAILKTTPYMGTDKVVFPYHSAVLATATGKHEMQGLLKFPGTTFVIPVHGIQLGNAWVVRSFDPALSNVAVANMVRPMGYRIGAWNAFSDLRVIQMDLTSDHAILGDGPLLDYTQQPVDPGTSLDVAVDFEFSSAKDLPDLAQAYQANSARAIWTRSDEANSFSQMADKAFAKAGCVTWFWGPFQCPGDLTGLPKKAAGTVMPMVQRMKADGGRVGFLDQNGNPAAESK